MRAYVTSIGEPTTDLCIWSLQRLGLDVVPIQDQSSLAWKLKKIYEQADDDFIRVDADVICNKNVLELPKMAPRPWWIQGQTFGWFTQDVIYGGVQFVKKQALPILRENITKFIDAERPESQMFRLDEFHNPRRCLSVNLVCGLHGYKQDDLSRVKATKARRGQTANYDWELMERVEAL